MDLLAKTIITPPNSILSSEYLPRNLNTYMCVCTHKHVLVCVCVCTRACVCSCILLVTLLEIWCVHLPLLVMLCSSTRLPSKHTVRYVSPTVEIRSTYLILLSIPFYCMMDSRVKRGLHK